MMNTTKHYQNRSPRVRSRILPNGIYWYANIQMTINNVYTAHSPSSKAKKLLILPDQCCSSSYTNTRLLINGPFRRAANPQKVLYLRSLMHPPTHLVCNDHLMANFLSFHMSLVVVMNCGAENSLRGFEISMFYFFLKLYFINISKDILPLRALSAIKQCK